MIFNKKISFLFLKYNVFRILINQKRKKVCAHIVI